MVSSEKYCFCFPRNLTCPLIGLISLIMNTLLMAAAAVFLCLESECEGPTSSSSGQHRSRLQRILHMSISDEAVSIVLWSVLATSTLAAAASIALVIAVRKSRTGPVLFYFGYFSFMAIAYLLAAILLLIAQHWIAALIAIGMLMVIMYLVVSVHGVYEGLQRGQVHGFGPHRRITSSDVGTCDARAGAGAGRTDGLAAGVEH